MFLNRYDIIFFCSSRVDEIWIRSTALHLSKFKLKIAIIVYNPRKEALPRIYQGYPIRIIPIYDIRFLKKYSASIVVSASTSIEKSFFSDKIRHFIHMPHSLASLHGIYPDNAFDTFDILFASTPFHVEEFKEIARIQNRSNPKIFKTGYGKLDILLEDSHPDQENNHVLIAPSWGDGNILETIGYELCLLLLEKGYKVTIRPHSMFYLEKREILDVFMSLQHEHFSIEDFSGSKAIYIADTLLTDYSGIAFEYLALKLNQRVIFVNTKQKILNERIDLYKLPLFEVEERSNFGLVVENDKDKVLNAIQKYKGKKSYFSDFIYNLGACGMVASHQLMDILDS